MRSKKFIVVLAPGDSIVIPAESWSRDENNELEFLDSDSDRVGLFDWTKLVGFYEAGGDNAN